MIEYAEYRVIGRGRSANLAESELAYRDNNDNLKRLIYVYDRNKRRRAIGEDGENCRCQELRGFHRGEIEVIGIRPWAVRGKMAIDVGSEKRRIESNDRTEVKRKLEMDRPKFHDPRTDVELSNSPIKFGRIGG